jgi:hypothetical protein
LRCRRSGRSSASVEHRAIGAADAADRGLAMITSLGHTMSVIWGNSGVSALREFFAARASLAVIENLFENKRRLFD